jgi:hypothetical protein
MEQSNLFEARQARDAGMQRVISHNLPWKDEALRFARVFLHTGEELTGEAIRLRLRNAGCPTPTHHNAWGPFIKSLVVSGMLIDTLRTGWMTTKKSHAARTPLWRVNNG